MFYAAGQVTGENVTTRSISLNLSGAGDNRVLYVFVCNHNPDGIASSVASISFGGQSLSWMGVNYELQGESNKLAIETWRLIAPPAVNGTVSITLDDPSQFVLCGAIALEDTDQDDPDPVSAQIANGTGTNVTDSTPTAVGELVIATAFSFGGNLTPGSGQTSRFSPEIDNDWIFCGTTEDGAGSSVTSSFTGSSGEPWYMISFSVVPAAIDAPVQEVSASGSGTATGGARKLGSPRTYKVLSGADDAFENDDGSGFDGTSAIVAVASNTTPASRVNGGLRFPGVVSALRGQIDSAILRINVINAAIDDIDAVIRAHDVDDAPDFNTVADVSSRVGTYAGVAWTQDSLGTGWVESPDIWPVIQEIVNKPGWTPYNGVSLLLLGNNAAAKSLWFNSYESNPALAAELVLTISDPDKLDIELEEVFSPGNIAGTILVSGDPDLYEDESGVRHMFFAGTRFAVDGIDIFETTLANSSMDYGTDIDNWISGISTDPIISRPVSGWDAFAIETPSYVEGYDHVAEESVRRIYYTGYETLAAGPAGPLSIGFAEWNGSAWVRHGDPVIMGDTTDEDWHANGYVLEPAVVYDDSLPVGQRWQMYYTAKDESGGLWVLRAHSDDGITWTKDGRVFDPNVVWSPHVRKVSNGHYEMLVATITQGSPTGGLYRLWAPTAKGPWNDPTQFLSTTNGQKWHRDYTYGAAISEAADGSLWIYFTGRDEHFQAIAPHIGRLKVDPLDVQFLHLVEASGSGVGTGSARATQVISASASGSGVGTGSASAIQVQTASASGSGTSSGNARAVTIALASASGSGTTTGAARALVWVPAAASGSGIGTGSARATQILVVEASGSSTSVGAARPLQIHLASATGSGTGTGSATPESIGLSIADASGFGTSTGSARALQIHLSSASGSAIATGSARVLQIHLASASGFGRAIGSATPESEGFVIAKASGSARGTGSARALQIHLASASGSGVGTGSATSGSIGVQTASASGSGRGTGSADGHIVISVTASGSGTAIGSARATQICIASASGFGKASGSARSVSIIVVYASASGYGTSAGSARALIIVLARASGYGAGSGAADPLQWHFVAASGYGTGTGTARGGTFVLIDPVVATARYAPQLVAEARYIADIPWSLELVGEGRYATQLQGTARS